MGRGIAFLMITFIGGEFGIGIDEIQGDLLIVHGGRGFGIFEQRPLSYVLR